MPFARLPDNPNLNLVQEENSSVQSSVFFVHFKGLKCIMGEDWAGHSLRCLLCLERKQKKESKGHFRNCSRTVSVFAIALRENPLVGKKVFFSLSELSAVCNMATLTKVCYGMLRGQVFSLSVLEGVCFVAVGRIGSASCCFPPSCT